MAVFNYDTTHASSNFELTEGRVKPEDVRVPAYLPDTPDMEHLAQTALAGVREEARVGRVAGEVADVVARRGGTLNDDEVYHWNFGYAVGLAHPPTWSDGTDWSILAGNEEMLQAGMAFHVAASFRRFGEGIVGLSHTLIIEESGPRVLTGHDARIIRV